MNNRLHPRLEPLRKIFIEQLPERLATIVDYHNSAIEAGLASERLEDLRFAVHTLKGAAATFGFTEASISASALEKVIDAAAALSQPDRVQARRDLSNALEKLRVTIVSSGIKSDEVDSGNRTYIVKNQIHSEKSIFLLEDDALSREFLSDQLKYYGYHVHSFSDSTLFQSAVENAPPDALIIDITIAGSELTGLDILRKLRQTLPAVPPVFIATVHVDIDTRIAAVRAGASAYFNKPIDMTELVAALDRLTTVEPAEPYRVLVVDDDAETAEYHAEILRVAGMKADVANSAEAALGRLAELNPDILLLDMYMPRISGPEFAEVTRQQSHFFGLPIIFLSSELDLDKQLATIAVGADDFLTKPVRASALISSITGRAARARLLRSMTNQDPMTKLLNHTATKERLRTEISRSLRSAKPIVFALIDIDHFKRINDTYGHPVGDAVIWGLARLLRQRLRQSDVIGRYGGEEFAVVMPETTLDQALVVLDDLREHFGKLHFLAGNTRFTVNFSCGAVSALPIEDAAEVILSADEALYKAKRNGRNQVCAE